MFKWKFMDFTWQNEAGPVSNSHFSVFPKNERSNKHGVIICNHKILEIIMIINGFLLFICISICTYRGRQNSLLGLRLGTGCYIFYLLPLILDQFVVCSFCHTHERYFEWHSQNFQCPVHAPHVTMVLKLKLTHHSLEDSNVLPLKGEKRENMLALPSCLTWNPTKYLISNFCNFFFFSIPLEKWSLQCSQEMVVPPSLE